MANGSDGITEALFECLLGADDTGMAELAAAVKSWRDTYPRSYASVMHRQPIACKLLTAIEEALQLRNEMES